MSNLDQVTADVNYSVGHKLIIGLANEMLIRPQEVGTAVERINKYQDDDGKVQGEIYDFGKEKPYSERVNEAWEVIQDSLLAVAHDRDFGRLTPRIEFGLDPAILNGRRKRDENNESMIKPFRVFDETQFMIQIVRIAGALVKSRTADSFVDLAEFQKRIKRMETAYLKMRMEHEEEDDDEFKLRQRLGRFVIPDEK